MGKSKRFSGICLFSLLGVFTTGICVSLLLDVGSASTASFGRALTTSELLGTFGDEKCKLSTNCAQGKVVGDKCRACADAENEWIMCCPFGDEGDWCTTKVEYSCSGQLRYEGDILEGSLEDCDVCDSDGFSPTTYSCKRHDARDDAHECD